MKCIGIDQNTMLVYEGDGYHGYGIWPTPTLIPAYLTSENSEMPCLASRPDLMTLPYLFLDESYDPVSRIRKGRIFENNKNQPVHWKVTRHPVQNNAIATMGTALCTYREFNFFAKLEAESIKEPCLILGTHNHSTIWAVVDAEGSISGEVVLYLKSRKVIGALPKVDYSLIQDAKNKEQIQEKFELLYHDLVSAAPDSVVDRCREAASAMGNAYLLNNGYIDKALDLGKAATKLAELAKLNIAANQASTLARLHARTKHSVQASLETRRLTEQDAEFAVQALGIIVIELGYGSW